MPEPKTNHGSLRMGGKNHAMILTMQDNGTGVLLEDLNSKFDAILESVGAMQDHVKKIPKMSERLEKIESDIAVIKLDAALTRNDTKLIKIRTEKLEDIQDELKELDKRVKALES